MDQTLAVYIPVDRRHALATGVPLPEHMEGAALFADISGFTALTEALTRELGPRRGAEELPRQLNRVYDALIQKVDHYGGSVIGFAGDAITCWFDQDEGRRATACSLAMQRAMRDFTTVLLPSGAHISLAMKVGIAAGAVRRFLVGDPRVQLIDVLAGATLTRMAAAEQVAEKGEVALSAPTAHALGAALDIQGWRTGKTGESFAIIAALRESISPQPWPALAPGSLHPKELRPWLLPVVYERLQAGHGELLTELRPAVALFLRFGGIDYDADENASTKLDSYVRWVQRILTPYDVSMTQLTIGDKGSYLYVAFGAPIAHENEDARAVLAALALRTPPPELAFIEPVQIGISRGTMRTGAYGGSTRRTYGVLGNEVNLAARLMQHAQPGEIIASGRVQAATASLFRWQGLGAISVKGKREAIAVFSLLGLRPADPIHLTEPPYTLPMIGRQAELTLIDEKMTLALQGQGQVVGITAEAGMGKSRLVAEAIRRAQQRNLPGYGGECQSYGMNTPYLVWQPIWRAFFALEVTDSPERQAQQVAHTVAALEPRLLPRLPLLGPVLGLPLPDNDLTRPLSPELRKASRESLLVDLLKARARSLGAEQGAVLLVLEDCHWLDAASHDLLEAIARAIWNEPVMVLLAYRPAELERLEAPRVSTLPYFTQLSLTELSQPEAMRLLTNRLAQLRAHQAHQPPPALLTELAERAQGNPFYLEELLNYLHDQGLDPYDPQTISRLELPTSLHSLILSRIDRLTEPQKVTLKVASIIGRLFRFDWLLGYYPALGEPERVKHDLDALSRLDLTPLERSEPERVYLFKHIVTREVAYGSLPYATRAQLHGQLAAFLEAQGSAIDGALDLLAYHYVHSENQDKVRHYLRLAGEAAQAAYANDAAQAYYGQLLPLLQSSDEQVEIHLRLGSVWELVGQWERAEAHYQAVLALAPTGAQADIQARGSLALGKLYRNRGQYQRAQEWLTQALASWDDLEAAEGRSQTLTELGVVAWRQGNYALARDYLGQSREDCQRRGDHPGLAYALNSLGIVAWYQGDYEEARELYEESLALFREMGDKRGTAWSLANLGDVAFNQANYGVAQARHEESLALRREIGEKAGMAASLLNLGLVAWNQGEYARARQRHEESLALRRDLGDQAGIAWSLNNLGTVAYSEGNYERARVQSEESLALFRKLGSKAGIAWSLDNLANVACSEGDYEQARARGEESMALFREMGDKSGLAAALTTLGAVAYWQENPECARNHYREGLTLAQSIGEKKEVVNALIGLAALSSEAGDPETLRQATRLVAAAEAQRQVIGLKLDPIPQTLYARVLAASHAHLSTADFATAWAEGQTPSP